MMIPFLKMHGCGNDFVVLDNRKSELPALNYKQIADRHFGIGCDQVVVLEASAKADIFMRLFNADGGEVESCGNASRCVAWVMRHQKALTIETLAGIIEAKVTDENNITIDMGIPKLGWHEIPLSHEMDTLHLPLQAESLNKPVAVNMGNPHAVFFVDDINAVSLERLGPLLEHDALFPQRANIGVAQVFSKEKINLRVWERGAGLTLACGTGACAALVAANLRGLTGRKAEVALPGGSLQIEWREQDNHVLMTGPVATSFEGMFNPTFYL